MSARRLGQDRTINDFEGERIGYAVAGDQAEGVAPGLSIGAHVDAQLYQVHTGFAAGGLDRRLGFHAFDGNCERRIFEAGSARARETIASQSGGKSGAAWSEKRVNRGGPRILARLRAGGDRERQSENNPERTHR